MKKAAIKREQSDACISYAERKQARTKFNDEFATAAEVQRQFTINKLTKLTRSTSIARRLLPKGRKNLKTKKLK